MSGGRGLRAAGALLGAALLAGCGSGEAASPLPAPASISAPGASNPTVAAAPGSEALYVAWVAREGEGEANVFLAASRGGAENFGDPVRVNDVPGDAAPHEQAPAQVAVGPEGNVYVLWQNNTPVEGRRFPASDLRLARSTDGGRSFEPAVTVNDDAGGLPSSHTFHDLTVGPDGTVYVSWIDSRVRDALRAAAPSAPAAPAGAGHGGHGGHGEEDLPGPEIRLAASRDGGRTFGPGEVVDSGACPCCRTSVALGPDGSVYVAWRKEFEGDVRDVVVARRRPGASGFDAPVLVHADGWSLPACPHAGPSVVVDGRGRVHVAWYTGREGRQGLWYAASDDGAASFSPPAPVLTDAWVPPSQARLAIGPDGRPWVAWEDRRSPERTVRMGRIDGSGAVPTAEDAALPGELPAVASGAGGPVAAWLDAGTIRVRPFGAAR